jgi:hypothetical protein
MSDREKLLIPVTRLLPNPFDKGPIDPELVQALRVSLRITGLGDVHLVGRPSKTLDKMWEIVDGKHTLRAIIEEFGTKAKVEVDVSDLTDVQMLQGGLFKNFVRRTVADEELRQFVIVAEQQLLANPEICPVRIRERKIAKENPLVEAKDHSKCPTQECVSLYLRVLELSPRDISRLFSKWKPSKKDPDKKDEPDKQKDGATSNDDSSSSQSGKDDKKTKTAEELAAVSAEEEKREAEKKNAKKKADEARKAATRKTEAVLKDIATARIELGIGEDDSITEAIKAIRGGVAIKSNQGGDAEMAAQARVLVLEEEMRKVTEDVSYFKKLREQDKASLIRKKAFFQKCLSPEKFQALSRDYPLELGNEANEFVWLEEITGGAKGKTLGTSG